MNELFKIIKAFYTAHNSEIIAALISLIVSVSTTLLLHFLSYPKLIYQEKAKLIGVLSDQKYKSIQKIRSSIQFFSTFEEVEFNSDITPKIFYKYENLWNAFETINQLLTYRDCLPTRPKIQLICMRNLLKQYAFLCKEAGFDNEMLRKESAVLYRPILKWYKKLDSILIKSLNHVSTKYYSENTLWYKFYLNYYSIYLNKSKIAILMQKIIKK